MCSSERDQSTKRGGKLSLCKQVMVGTGIEHRHNGVKNVLKLYLQRFFFNIYILKVFAVAGVHSASVLMLQGELD